MLSSTALDSVGTNFRLNFFWLARRHPILLFLQLESSMRESKRVRTAPCMPDGPLIVHHEPKNRPWPEPSTKVARRERQRGPNPKLSLSQPSARQTCACHCLNLSPSQPRVAKDDVVYNWCERLGRWLLVVAWLPRASRADFTGLTRSCHSFSGPRH